MKELESLDAAFLEATRQMPETAKRRVLRKMMTTAATVAVLLPAQAALGRKRG